jgi:hypothetical protein
LILRWLGLPNELQERFLRDWGMDLEKIPTAESAVRTLLVSGLVVTLLTALWFARREFRVKTPEGS